MKHHQIEPAIGVPFGNGLGRKRTEGFFIHSLKAVDDLMLRAVRQADIGMIGLQHLHSSHRLSERNGICVIGMPGLAESKRRLRYRRWLAHGIKQALAMLMRGDRGHEAITTPINSQELSRLVPGLTDDEGIAANIGRHIAIRTPGTIATNEEIATLLDTDDGNRHLALTHRKHYREVPHRYRELADGKRNGFGFARKAEARGRSKAYLAMLFEAEKHGILVKERKACPISFGGSIAIYCQFGITRRVCATIVEVISTAGTRQTT